METAVKFLRLAVIAVITAAVVAGALSVAKIGISSIKNFADDLALRKDDSKGVYSMYDDTEVNGEQVLQAIRVYRELCEVHTGQSDNDGRLKEGIDVLNAIKSSVMNNPNDKDYVNPLGIFTAHLIYDKADSEKLVTILFNQKKTKDTADATYVLASDPDDPDSLINSQNRDRIEIMQPFIYVEQGFDIRPNSETSSVRADDPYKATWEQLGLEVRFIKAGCSWEQGTVIKNFTTTYNKGARVAGNAKEEQLVVKVTASPSGNNTKYTAACYVTICKPLEIYVGDSDNNSDNDGTASVGSSVKKVTESGYNNCYEVTAQNIIAGHKAKITSSFSDAEWGKKSLASYSKDTDIINWPGTGKAGSITRNDIQRDPTLDGSKPLDGKTSSVYNNFISSGGTLSVAWNEQDPHSSTAELTALKGKYNGMTFFNGNRVESITINKNREDTVTFTVTREIKSNGRVTVKDKVKVTIPFSELTAEYCNDTARMDATSDYRGKQGISRVANGDLFTITANAPVKFGFNDSAVSEIFRTDNKIQLKGDISDDEEGKGINLSVFDEISGMQAKFAIGDVANVKNAKPIYVYCKLDLDIEYQQFDSPKTEKYTEATYSYHTRVVDDGNGNEKTEGYYVEDTPEIHETEIPTNEQIDGFFVVKHPLKMFLTFDESGMDKDKTTCDNVRYIGLIPDDKENPVTTLSGYEPGWYDNSNGKGYQSRFDKTNGAGLTDEEKIMNNPITDCGNPLFKNCVENYNDTLQPFTQNQTQRAKGGDYYRNPEGGGKVTLHYRTGKDLLKEETKEVSIYKDEVLRNLASVLNDGTKANRYVFRVRCATDSYSDPLPIIARFPNFGNRMVKKDPTNIKVNVSEGTYEQSNFKAIPDEKYTWDSSNPDGSRTSTIPGGITDSTSSITGYEYEMKEHTTPVFHPIKIHTWGRNVQYWVYRGSEDNPYQQKVTNEAGDDNSGVRHSEFKGNEIYLTLAESDPKTNNLVTVIVKGSDGKYCIIKCRFVKTEAKLLNLYDKDLGLKASTPATKDENGKESYTINETGAKNKNISFNATQLDVLANANLVCAPLPYYPIVLNSGIQLDGANYSAGFHTLTSAELTKYFRKELNENFSGKDKMYSIQAAYPCNYLAFDTSASSKNTSKPRYETLDTPDDYIGKKLLSLIKSDVDKSKSDYNKLKDLEVISLSESENKDANDVAYGDYVLPILATEASFYNDGTIAKTCAVKVVTGNSETSIDLVANGTANSKGKTSSADAHVADDKLKSITSDFAPNGLQFYGNRYATGNFLVNDPKDNTNSDCIFKTGPNTGKAVPLRVNSGELSTRVIYEAPKVTSDKNKNLTDNAGYFEAYYKGLSGEFSSIEDGNGVSKYKLKNGIMANIEFPKYKLSAYGNYSSYGESGKTTIVNHDGDSTTETKVDNDTSGFGPAFQIGKRSWTISKTNDLKFSMYDIINVTYGGVTFNAKDAKTNKMDHKETNTFSGKPFNYGVTTAANTAEDFYSSYTNKKWDGSYKNYRGFNTVYKCGDSSNRTNRGMYYLGSAYIFTYVYDENGKTVDGRSNVGEGNLQTRITVGANLNKRPLSRHSFISPNCSKYKTLEKNNNGKLVEIEDSDKLLANSDTYVEGIYKQFGRRHKTIKLAVIADRLTYTQSISMTEGHVKRVDLTGAKKAGTDNNSESELLQISEYFPYNVNDLDMDHVFVERPVSSYANWVIKSTTAKSNRTTDNLSADAINLFGNKVVEKETDANGKETEKLISDDLKSKGLGELRAELKKQQDATRGTLGSKMKVDVPGPNGVTTKEPLLDGKHLVFSSNYAYPNANNLYYHISGKNTNIKDGDSEETIKEKLKNIGVYGKITFYFPYKDEWDVNGPKNLSDLKKNGHYYKLTINNEEIGVKAYNTYEETHQKYVNDIAEGAGVNKDTDNNGTKVVPPYQIYCQRVQSYGNKVVVSGGYTHGTKLFVSPIVDDTGDINPLIADGDKDFKSYSLNLSAKNNSNNKTTYKPKAYLRLSYLFASDDNQADATENKYNAESIDLTNIFDDNVDVATAYSKFTAYDKFDDGSANLENKNNIDIKLRTSKDSNAITDGPLETATVVMKGHLNLNNPSNKYKMYAINDYMYNPDYTKTFSQWEDKRKVDKDDTIEKTLEEQHGLYADLSISPQGNNYKLRMDLFDPYSGKWIDGKVGVQFPLNISIKWRASIADQLEQIPRMGYLKEDGTVDKSSALWPKYGTCIQVMDSVSTSGSVIKGYYKKIMASENTKTYLGLNQLYFFDSNSKSNAKTFNKGNTKQMSLPAINLKADGAAHAAGIPNTVNGNGYYSYSSTYNENFGNIYVLSNLGTMFTHESTVKVTADAMKYTDVSPTMVKNPKTENNNEQDCYPSGKTSLNRWFKLRNDSGISVPLSNISKNDNPEFQYDLDAAAYTVKSGKNLLKYMKSHETATTSNSSCATTINIGNNKYYDKNQSYHDLLDKYNSANTKYSNWIEANGCSGLSATQIKEKFKNDLAKYNKYSNLLNARNKAYQKLGTVGKLQMYHDQVRDTINGHEKTIIDNYNSYWASRAIHYGELLSIANSINSAASSWCSKDDSDDEPDKDTNGDGEIHYHGVNNIKSAYTAIYNETNGSGLANTLTTDTAITISHIKNAVDGLKLRNGDSKTIMVDAFNYKAEPEMTNVNGQQVRYQGPIIFNSTGVSHWPGGFPYLDVNYYKPILDVHERHDTLGGYRVDGDINNIKSWLSSGWHEGSSASFAQPAKTSTLNSNVYQYLIDRINGSGISHTSEKIPAGTGSLYDLCTAYENLIKYLSSNGDENRNTSFTSLLGKNSLKDEIESALQKKSIADIQFATNPNQEDYKVANSRLIGVTQYTENSVEKYNDGWKVFMNSSKSGSQNIRFTYSITKEDNNKTWYLDEKGEWSNNSSDRAWAKPLSLIDNVSKITENGKTYQVDYDWKTKTILFGGKFGSNLSSLLNTNTTANCVGYISKKGALDKNDTKYSGTTTKFKNEEFLRRGMTYGTGNSNFPKVSVYTMRSWKTPTPSDVVMVGEKERESVKGFFYHDGWDSEDATIAASNAAKDKFAVVRDENLFAKDYFLSPSECFGFANNNGTYKVANYNKAIEVINSSNPVAFMFDFANIKNVDNLGKFTIHCKIVMQSDQINHRCVEYDMSFTRYGLGQFKENNIDPFQ
jgi:hypothetical protein